MTKTVAIVLLIALVAIGIYFVLPVLVRALGRHPDYEGLRFNAMGKRALMTTASQPTLGSGGKKMGVSGSEMTAPYYEFQDAGMEVDVASVRGGKIPVDGQSFVWFIADDADRRYLKDPTSSEEGRTIKIDRRASARELRHELGMTEAPQHPERELRAAGANFDSETKFRGLFANHVVVDGRLVTGQNQNAGSQVAQETMRVAGGTTVAD